MGFQNGILATVSVSDALRKMVRVRIRLAGNRATKCILRLVGAAIETVIRMPSKTEKKQKNPVKNFFQF
jgi:hypothetical protein